jgi:hypothetical protein
MCHRTTLAFNCGHKEEQTTRCDQDKLKKCTNLIPRKCLPTFYLSKEEKVERLCSECKLKKDNDALKRKRDAEAALGWHD